MIEYSTIKVDKETYEILKHIKEEQGINIVKYVSMAVKEKYKKNSK